MQQRRHYDWFDHPWRKVSLLLFANIFYTAPLTALMLAAWFRLAGFPSVDWSAVRLVTLMNVICVVFITHVYETVYLIQQRESDLVAVARLDRARAEAELLALKSQVSPHFLFNSLNALAHLIPKDPAEAVAFTEGLADMYRYILMNGDKLVFLRDRHGTQYLVDRPLQDLEAELDPALFFRLNRKYLAHVNAVKRFRPGEKGKVLVALHPEPAEPVVVSQERGAAFRSWLGRGPAKP